MAEMDDERSALRGAIDFVGPLVLAATCVLALPFVYGQLGPWAGLAAALAVLVAWLSWGAEPFRGGVLAEALTLSVLLNSLAWCVISIVALIR